MTATPAATAETLPDAFTVAMLVSELDQVTVDVPVIVESTVAVSVSLPSTTIEVLDLLSDRALGLLYADAVSHAKSPFGITCAGMVDAVFCSMPPLPSVIGLPAQK